MIAGKSYSGLVTDIWSSGVILYAMVCGFLPFEELKTAKLYKKILAGDFKLPRFLSTQCASFLQSILTVNPSERATISEIRKHTWYNQFADKAPRGLFPCKQLMPLDNDIYETLIEKFKFDPDYAAKCIEANRHNEVTSAYHLLSKKARRCDTRDKAFKALSLFNLGKDSSHNDTDLASMNLNTEKNDSKEGTGPIVACNGFQGPS